MPGFAVAADAVPATGYFPILPYDAGSDTAPQLMPVATNHPLTEAPGGSQNGQHRGITRAIIFLHDQGRDANAALAVMSALAGSANSETLIVAPQFLIPTDLARFGARMPGGGQAFASWQMDGWARGDDSVVKHQAGISSFTVIDLLLIYLADRRVFPDLRTVVVAGYGAGANFVQRYAGFSQGFDVLDRENIALRFVVAGASSYMYQTATRPLFNAKGGAHGFGRPDDTACPDYDLWPYGLQKLNPATRRVGANAAKEGYATRKIVYLTGTADAAPDGNCAAVAEGPDAAARAASYRTYLGNLYGDLAAQTQQFAATKDGNDAAALYGSPCGMAALFGDGLCPAPGFNGFGGSP